MPVIMDLRTATVQNHPLADPRLLRRALALLVAALAAAIGLWLAMQSRVEVSLGDYSRYQCLTGRASGPEFRVLTLTSVDAMAMADRLCASPAFSSRFSAISISWRPRQFLSAQHIVDESFDFFWNRQHLVEGMVPEANNYYRPLLHTPSYALYWISHDQDLRLQGTYFADKTVGLLQDTRSQTFFLQPFKALKSAGIELRDEQKRFYPDMEALFQGFASGEVDVITGIPRLMDRYGVNSYHSLLLAEQVPSGSWFVRNRWFDELGCELARLTGPDPLFSQPPELAVGLACPEMP